MSKRRNKNKFQNRDIMPSGVPTPAVETNPAYVPEPVRPEAIQNELPRAIQNGFGEAIGYIQPFGGFAGIPNGPSNQMVEQSDTSFDALRWYLVSNFRQLLSQLFAEIGLVQTIVCVPVDDGLRGGVMIKSKQLSEDEIKDLTISIDRDGDLETAGWAAKWERLYGGAGILVLVGDQDPEEPLNLADITEDTSVEFRAVDMWELFWDKQNTEGYDPEIQSEQFEFYNYYAENVHRTRVMRLKGIMAPSFVRPRLRGWGISVVETLIRSMNQYLKATDLGFQVLDEFKLDVYKIKNLVNTLMYPGGTSKIKERVQMANWQKNYQHAVVMDAEDDFDHKQLSFAGLAEAMSGIRMQVASDMRMPILKLFGQSTSSGGLGTSSVEEMENYNSMVESEVRNKLKYHILRILEIKCQKLFGYIPEDLEIEFKPLRELSATDLETVKAAKFDRLDRAKAAGEITTLEYRDAANKGQLFDVVLDTTTAALNNPELGLPSEDDASESDKKDPYEDTDSDDPGANREDSRKVKLQTDHVKKGKAISKNSIMTFNAWDKFKRFTNSPAFDKASYAADGGDDWIQDKRQELFTVDGASDKALWTKAVSASHASFNGEENHKFIIWWYKKQGGKFS